MKHSMRSFSKASALVVLLATFFATLLIDARVASAQLVGGESVAVQIKGYWGGTTDKDSQVLGTLKMVDEKGKSERSFGVTYARTYDPVTIGMDVFQQAAIRPAHVVYGREKEVSAFFGAPDGKPISVIGTYWANAGELILGSVTVSDAAAGATKPSTGKASH
jgi:hypothetical protein